MDLQDTNKRLEDLERKLLLVLDTHLALLVIIDPQSSSPSSNVLHYIKGDDFNDDLYEQIVSRNSGTHNYFYREDMAPCMDDLVESSPELQAQEFDDDYLPLPPRLPPREIDPDRHYGLYEFSGPDPLHCTLGRDEPVYLLNDDDNYWWLIRKLSTEEKNDNALEDPEDGKIGFVPAECLETYGERLARLNCFKNEEIEKIDVILNDQTKKRKGSGKAVKFSQGVIYWEDETCEKHTLHPSEPKRIPLELDFDTLEDPGLEGEPLGGISRPIVVMDELDEEDDQVETPVQAYPDHMFSMGLLKAPASHVHADGSTSGAGLEIVSEVYSDKVLVVEKRKKSTSPPVLTEENSNSAQRTSNLDVFNDLQEFIHENMIDEYNFTNDNSLEHRESETSQQDLNSPKLMSPEAMKSDKMPITNDLDGKHKISTAGKIEEFLQKLNLTEDEAQLLEFNNSLDDNDVNFDLDDSSITQDLVIKKSNYKPSSVGQLGSPIMHREEAQKFQSDLNQYIFNENSIEEEKEQLQKTETAGPETRRTVSAGERLVNGHEDSVMSTPKGDYTLGSFNDLISHKSTPLSKKSPSLGKKKKRKNSPRMRSDLYSMSPYSPGTPMRASWSRVSSDLYRRLDIMDQLNQMTADIQEQFGIVDEIGTEKRLSLILGDLAEEGSEISRGQEANVSRVSSIEKSSVISTPTPARANKYNELVPQTTRDFDFNLQDCFSDALFNSIRRSTTEVNADPDDTPLTSTALLVDKREKSIQEMFVPILGKFDELAERLAELNNMI